MSNRNTKTGDISNNNFAMLLDKFDEATNEQQWNALIEEAKIREPLTFRQREAVIARCENSIKGIYGKSKANVQFKAA